MRRFVALSVFVLLLAPAAAFAQNEMKDSFVKPWAGFHFTGGLSNATSSAGKPKAYGLSLGFWQRGIVGGEFEFGIAKNYFLATSPVGSGNDLITVTGNAMIGPWIHFSDNQAVRPYFLIGGGLVRSDFDGFTNFGANSQNRGVIDLGGGLNFYFMKGLGICFDVRVMKDFGQKTGSSFGLTNTTYKRASFGLILGF